MNPYFPRLFATFFAAHFSAVAVAAAAAVADMIPKPGDIRLLLSDPLTAPTPVAGELQKTSQQGEFTADGWRSLGRDGMLVIELAAAVTLEGALEVDLTGVDWPRASTASGRDTKLHFINMFSHPKGDHHVEGGGTAHDALWTLRAGASKDGQPRYGDMFKVLGSSRGAKRTPESDYHEHEVAAPAGWKWDPAARYTFRVTWSRARGTWTVAVNGQPLAEQPWKNQVSPLRYVFLGKAGDFQSLQGPLFSNLRVYATATPPEPAIALDALHVSTIEVDGFVPYYRDSRRNALAIAANLHKDVFAAARTPFTGPAGHYNLTLVSLTERDGESTYRVKLDGRLLGEVRNPPAIDDVEVRHGWPAIALRSGAVLQIESNSVANGKVPEGDGFGYARGRWRQIVFTPTALIPPP